MKTTKKMLDSFQVAVRSSVLKIAKQNQKLHMWKN